MNERLNKIIVGLALWAEIYNKRFNQTLFDLYSSPSLDGIKALYDRFINSNDHFDREVAFWLQPALEQTPLKIDLKNLVDEMKEMEFILFDLLWRVDAENQHDINDWLNYMTNATYSIQDGYWVDAKILMSQALQSSKKISVKGIKKDPRLRYEIELLQRETLRCFEQVKMFPFKLRISEERLDAILEVQEILIELMPKYFLGHPKKKVEDLISYPIQNFSAALRYLMRSDIKTERVSKEVGLASEHLKRQINNITDKKILEWARKIYERVKILSAQFSYDPQ